MSENQEGAMAKIPLKELTALLPTPPVSWA
jgi:hypothetical protein